MLIFPGLRADTHITPENYKLAMKPNELDPPPFDDMTSFQILALELAALIVISLGVSFAVCKVGMRSFWGPLVVLLTFVVLLAGYWKLAPWAIVWRVDEYWGDRILGSVIYDVLTLVIPSPGSVILGSYALITALIAWYWSSVDHSKEPM
ncbi:MAG: hypothetical protein AAF415_15550 [Pseudomonadota bacterium]